ncbi:MAG: lytic murein transglycosylase [Candidatus Binatia bacterium]|nr:lytic murein transglycosylase [Candidatus Binatia bacterium]
MGNTPTLRLFVCVLAGLQIFTTPCPARARGGWDYLLERLIRDGEPRSEIEAIFTDPRMPPFQKLEFAPERRPEPAGLYRGFLRPQSVAQLRQCWYTYRAEIEAAERRTGVPGTLLVSLLHVESRCGQNTGGHRILFRLARLAMAGEPNNLRWNLALWLDGPRRAADDLAAKLASRARYLEDTFYPEVRATLELARRWRVDPLELRGSTAGALGWPQFLPSSVLRFGRDGNSDGRVDLFDPADAALSAAEYLRAHGWTMGATSDEQRQALWHYNRSRSYGDTLLALHRRLQPEARPQPSQTLAATSRASSKRKQAKSPRAHRARPR